MSDEFTWARERQIHSDFSIENTRCNGCEEMSIDKAWVLNGGHNRPSADGVVYTPYWCRLLHRHLTKSEVHGMSKEECPKGRELKRRWR